MTQDTGNTRVLQIAVALVLLTTAICPVRAQQFEPELRLAFDLALVNPSGDVVSTEVGVGGVSVDIDSKAGAGFRFEYRFTRALGVEFGLLGASSFDVNVGDTGNGIGVATGVNSFAPLTLGFNYHFPAGDTFDLFAGPFLAFVRYGDVSVQTGTGGVVTAEAVDTDTGWGVILGADLPLGSGNWLLHSNLRYIDTSMKGANSDGRFDSDFDPLIFSIGFGYRF
jgi:outer membrane protein W